MHFTTLSLVFVALTSVTTTLASPPSHRYVQHPVEELISYQRHDSVNGIPPPPHPAELAPRSIHHSRPSRYHSSSVASGTRRRVEEEKEGKRRLMGAAFKQVTANEVKKRAMEKKKEQEQEKKKEIIKDTKKKKEGDHHKKGGKKEGRKVRKFEIKRSANEEAAEGDEGAEDQVAELEGQVDGWSWVDDNESVSTTSSGTNRGGKNLSWAQRMEVRMRKTKPLFAQI